MRLLRATASDAREMAELLAECWRSAYRGLVPDGYLDSLDREEWADRIRRSLEMNAEETYVCRRGGELAGFVTVGACRDEDARRDVGEIWGLYVSPRRWRNRLGTLLCRHGEEVLARQGFSEVDAWVFEGNREGRRFWEAMGFQPDGASRTLERGVTLRALRYRKTPSR